MAQGQTTATAIAMAFSMLPGIVKSLRKSKTPGMSNEDRHATAFDLATTALAAGGVLVGANNPALAPLINATIQATVEEQKADGTQALPAGSDAGLVT